MPAVSIDYVLRPGEKIGDGVTRILSEMAHRAKGFARPSKTSTDDLIHEGRLIIKRMRAVLWFSKTALGSKACARAKTRLRKAAGLLTARRDQMVMQATLQNLVQKAEKPKELMATTQILRSMARGSEAEPPGKSLRQILANSMDLVGATVAGLKTNVRGDAKWPVPAQRLKKAFRVSQRAGKRARRTKDDTDFHEWRKKAKRLLYLLELTQADPTPEKAQMRKQVEELQQALGGHHDTVVARNYFQKAAHPSSAIKRVLRLLNKRQSHLRKQADKVASDF